MFQERKSDVREDAEKFDDGNGRNRVRGDCPVRRMVAWLGCRAGEWLGVVFASRCRKIGEGKRMKAFLIAVAFVLAGFSAHASEGTCVAQQKLQDKGYYNGAIDCDWGPQTERALKRFQRDRGLLVDGVAGEDTMKALRQSGGRGEVRYESYAEPRLQEGGQRNCKRDLISEIGAARITEGMAKTSALKNWARKVRFKYGELYTDFANARDAETRCTKSNIGTLYDNYRCEINGVPCLAAN